MELTGRDKMHEVSPTVWIGDRVQLGDGVVLGQCVRVWGPTRIGAGSIIDDCVAIGHPDPVEAGRARSRLGASLRSLAQMDDDVTAETVIGPGSTIRSGTVIYSGVRTGKNFDCAHNVVVREGCALGDDCYLKVAADLRRDVRIGDHATICGTVADRSVIGNDVTTMGHLMHTYRSGRRGEIEYGPTIEDNAFIGRRACVIGPICIGKGAYVSAGTIVMKDVPAWALVSSARGEISTGRSPLLRSFRDPRRDKDQ
jgi:UDP-3-O-[3-hydroxymyristoyl] glucosamine N-acyltransferase